jgi:hypothetical protein
MPPVGFEPKISVGERPAAAYLLKTNAVGHERLELYLYSSYGPYGLYRASVPVQGYSTLPYQVFQKRTLFDKAFPNWNASSSVCVFLTWNSNFYSPAHAPAHNFSTFMVPTRKRKMKKLV